MSKVVKVKYPRIMVSNARHTKLSIEARKRDMTLEELAEEKFKATE